MKRNNVLIDENMLVCPVCGDQYLHQHEVDVYFRDENANEGSQVRISNSRTEIRKDQIGNPSPRRDGIRIKFMCEAGHDVYMAIIQHKGNTIVEWN